jgi:dynein heavy chain
MGKGGGKGEGKGAVADFPAEESGNEPSSPVKQRGLYSEYLSDVSDGLRREAMQGPDSSKYMSGVNVSSSWEPKIKGLTAPAIEQGQLDVGLTRTTEPKLQVPYKTALGQPPRQVVLERERRFYSEQDLTELLLAEGADFSQDEESPAQKYPSTMGLPLELFDDTEFDCRTPEEWVGLGKAEDRSVPAVALFALEGDGALGSEWVAARVLEYDTDSDTFLVSRPDTGAEKWAARLHICFTAESPFEFAKRVGGALQRRHEAEASLRYNLFVDCMPTEDIPPLDQGQLSRMLANSLSTKGLKEGEIDVAPLLHEINLDFMRTQSKFVLDAAVSVAQISEGEGSGGALDSVFSAVVIPEAELNYTTRKAAPAQGCILVENDGFLDKVSDFTFASLLTQPKVVQCMTRVRNECNWVLASSPLRYDINRTVPRKEWESVQSQATTSLKTELQEKWGVNIRNIIVSCLRDVGKGWFNLHETSRDIYEFSKLKRLLKLVTFCMEDTLRFMLEQTVGSYADFIENASAGAVSIAGANDVTLTDSSRAGLFALQMVPTDGPEGGISFDLDPSSFAESSLNAFDAALAAPASVEKVDHQVRSAAPSAPGPGRARGPAGARAVVWVRAGVWTRAQASAC